MPEPSVIDPEVRALLVDAMDSIETLDVTMALCRARPGARTIDGLVAALELPPDTIAAAIEGLERASVIRAVPGSESAWELAPSPRWASAVDKLYGAYERDRFEVVSWLATVALSRLRSRAASVFADAFVVRRRRDKGDPDA